MRKIEYELTCRMTNRKVETLYYEFELDELRDTRELSIDEVALLNAVLRDKDALGIKTVLYAMINVKEEWEVEEAKEV